MVVRLVGAGHVRADLPAVALGVVLVLHPDAGPEQRGGKTRDVARREEVVASADAPVVVDDDAVVDLEAGRLGELGLGNDAEPGDDDVRVERAPARRW